MRHLFDFFSGYVLRPRGVAIRNRTILFEIGFKFFFAHTSSLSAFYSTVEAKAERVVTFSGRQNANLRIPLLKIPKGRELTEPGMDPENWACSSFF